MFDNNHDANQNNGIDNHKKGSTFYQKIDNYLKAKVPVISGIMTIFSVTSTIVLKILGNYYLMMLSIGVCVVSVGTIVIYILNNRFKALKVENSTLRSNVLHQNAIIKKINDDVEYSFQRLHRLFRHNLHLYENNPTEYYDGKKLLFDKDVLQFLGDCNSLFKVILGVDLHICIKAAFYQEGELMFTTYKRDDVTPARKATDYKIRDFVLTDSSAIMEIVENGARWFCENNIDPDTDYVNPDPKWHTKYDSALVVPIRRNNQNDSDNQIHFGDQGTLGYFCVDSRGGGFNGHCINLACFLATVMFRFMEADRVHGFNKPYAEELDTVAS